MSDLDRDLETELHRVLDPLGAQPVPARRAVRSGGRAKTMLGGAGAVLTIKILSGVAVAAAAVSVAGAATTGSLNPTVWTHEVTTEVAKHSGAAPPSVHQNGNDNANGAAKDPGTAKGNGKGNGTTNGQGQDTGGNGQGNGQSGGGRDPEPVDPASPDNPKHITPKP